MQVFVPGNSVSGTGAANGYLTVTTNVGIYPGAKGFIRKADGTLPQYCMISEISGTTLVGIRFLPEGMDDVKLRTGEVKFPYYGRSDISAYTAGSTFFMDAQLVEVYQPIFDPLQVA